MSALTTPADPALSSGSEATVAVVAKRRAEALRRLPAKAKVGVAILALFILVAISPVSRPRTTVERVPTSSCESTS